MGADAGLRLSEAAGLTWGATDLGGRRLRVLGKGGVVRPVALTDRAAQALADLPLGLPPERDGTRHVYHQFPVYTRQRDALQAHLKAAGVGTGVRGGEQRLELRPQRVGPPVGLGRGERIHRGAVELTDHDGLAAHADIELGIDPGALTNPLHAAAASAVAFTGGAVLPLAAMMIAPASSRVVLTVAIVLVALAIAGVLSARLGHSRVRIAVARVVVGGAAGLALTYAIGRFFGTAVG